MKKIVIVALLVAIVIIILNALIVTGIIVLEGETAQPMGRGFFSIVFPVCACVVCYFVGIFNGVGTSKFVGDLLRKGEIIEVVSSTSTGTCYVAMVRRYPFSESKIFTIRMEDPLAPNTPYHDGACRPVQGHRYIWTGKYLRDAIK